MRKQKHGTLGALVLIVSLWAGCAPKPAASGPAAGPGPGGATQVGAGATAAPKPAVDYSADEVLKQLLATYRQAKSYQDQAIVRLAFRQDGQPVSQEWPAAVVFERPNRLSLAAYQATVKCDGKELRARIDDPETANVDNQVVVRSAPKELKLT